MSRLYQTVRPVFRHPARTLLLGLAGLILASSLSAQSNQAQGRGLLKQLIRDAGGRVLIGMRPDSLTPGMLSRGQSSLSDNAAAAIARHLESKGLKQHGRFSIIPVVFGEVAEADVDQLLDDPQVEYIEPDVAMPLAVHSNGPSFRLIEDLPWGITDVTAPDAWALGGSGAYGAGIKVAYLDSGADQSHPDLLLSGGYNPVSGSGSDWNDDIASCNGHGTHVAGTIAARHNDVGVVGVAPEVSLYAIKVFQDMSGSCLAYTSSQISGLDWAVKNGVRVVSVSIGGTSFSSSYQSAISSAASKGTYMVAAAGNNGSSTMTFPGGYQDVISVASVDGGNNHSSWSNYGPTLTISAPGESILSTMPGGSYGYKSGTSMATPHVAGVVALILAHYPGISRTDMLNRLQAGALDLGAAGRDDVYGWGLARAREAMDGSVAPPPPPPPPVPLAMSVSPSSRKDSVVAGATSGPATSATVSLSGDNNGTTGWSASARHSWTQLTSASGTGSGTAQWSRNPTGLAVGIYVDTITVVANSLSGTVIDSLIVNAAPPPLPLTEVLSPSSRYKSVKQGTGTINDSAQVILSGAGASLAPWAALNLQSWSSLTVAAGVGSGTVRWTRNYSLLAAGTYVDTITVSVVGAVGSPGRIIDSLVVTPPKGKSAKNTNRTVSNGTSVGDGESLHSDSVYVDAAPGTNWQATTGAGWVRFLTSTGSGPGYLRWQRDLVGMSFGVSADSILVTSGSGDTREVELVVTETIVTGADQIAAPLAAGALFGAQGLSELQGRMLDLLGNANGRYDVGDLLAHLDRTGFALSPAMLSRVMALPKPSGNRRQP
jgi:subtilisin